MDFLQVGILGVLGLLLFLFMGLHIGINFLFIGFVGLGLMLGFEAAFSLLGETLYFSIATPTFCALPLFILMGAFASKGGFAETAYKALHKICARLPGSLAIATAFGCAAFSSISGSSLATASLFGRLAYPEMIRYKYDKVFALGSIACSGTFACMIPPSGMFILFAIFTDLSIGKLFLAGILPGLLTAVIYATSMFLRAKFNPELAPISEAELDVTIRDRFHGVVEIWPIMVLGGLVIGGIYTGIFTATEAGAVGVLGTFLFGLYFGKLRKFIEVKSALSSSARTASMLFFIIVTAMFFSRFLAVTNIPTTLASLLSTWEVHRMIILLCIFALWIVLGMLIVQAAVFALTLPIVFPIVVSLGYDPIWFCIVAMKLNEIAGVTPPVGLNAFSLAGTVGKGTRVEEVYRGVFPYILCDIVVLIILFLWPELPLYLPNAMG